MTGVPSLIQIAPPPWKLHVARRDIEKIQETSADHLLSAYRTSGVGRKGRIMDDKIPILNVDGPSILKVPCGAPGHRGNFRKFLLGLAIIHVPNPHYSR
jgi:hypothetical protein